MRQDPLKPSSVRTLARIAGIELPEEDVAKLIAALRQHLSSIEALPTREIPDVEPPLLFRATWDD